MLIIFMRKYLKGRLVYNGIIVCFGKDYILMTPLVRSERFGGSVSERYKVCRVRWRCWLNTNATVNGGIGYLLSSWRKICLNTPLQCHWHFKYIFCLFLDGIGYIGRSDLIVMSCGVVLWWIFGKILFSLFPMGC